jgi:hypothetical protein
MYLKGVKELVTEKVEATVEHVGSNEKVSLWADVVGIKRN